MRHILLYELDDAIATLLKQKLEQAGFIVSLAASTEPPAEGVDLVIALDTLKPEYEGWLSTPPVIFLGHQAIPDHHHLELPFRPSDLLDLARSSLLAAS